MNAHRKKIIAIKGKALTLRGNDIDTDRIIPARFLKEISFARMGDYPFFDERFTTGGELKNHPFNDQARQEAKILVVNENFGCGSSREHAPQALKRWGIQAIVAESLAEIFAGNCSMIGLAAVTMDPGELKELQRLVEKDPSLVLTLDLKGRQLSCGGETWKVELPESRRTALTEGYWDSTAMILENMSRAREKAESLPYMTIFNS